MAELNVELVHDLRMPLQLIYSCAQLIQLEVGDARQPAGQYVEMLMDCVGQVQRMLGGALESGRRQTERPRLADGDLAGCVRGLCRRCRPYADERGVELISGGNVAALNMALDEDKLSRILLNLISNALRFTPRGGRIRVTWTAMGDWVEVCVSDSGPGIAPERLPCVFLPGETDGGHGYGLSIARKYARLLGGDLAAVSEPGRGSAFTLRLPVRAAASTEA